MLAPHEIRDRYAKVLVALKARPFHSYLPKSASCIYCPHLDGFCLGRDRNHGCKTARAPLALGHSASSMHLERTPWNRQTASLMGGWAWYGFDHDVEDWELPPHEVVANRLKVLDRGAYRCPACLGSAVDAPFGLPGALVADFNNPDLEPLFRRAATAMDLTYLAVKHAVEQFAVVETSPLWVRLSGATTLGAVWMEALRQPMEAL